MAAQAASAGWEESPGSLGRVLGNAQAFRGMTAGRRIAAQKHTADGLMIRHWAQARVKSGGKSARPVAVTRRRPNPTWSKAK